MRKIKELLISFLINSTCLKSLSVSKKQYSDYCAQKRLDSFLINKFSKNKIEGTKSCRLSNYDFDMAKSAQSNNSQLNLLNAILMLSCVRMANQ